MEIIAITSIIVLCVWTMIDIVRARFKEPTMKTLCILGVLFHPILGIIVYPLLRKTLLQRERRKFEPKFI